VPTSSDWPTHGKGVPPPSSAIHCVNGNLLRALIGFGWLDDARGRRAVDWQAAAITGEGDIRFYRSSVPGPGFCCGSNEGWRALRVGATKALLAMARIPPGLRPPYMQRAIDASVGASRPAT
jgi:hypothetical protein